MSLLDLFFVAAVTVFTTAAAISDLTTRKLPNWLTVSAFVAGLLTHTVIDGLAGLGFSLLGFVTGFGILLVLWLIGGPADLIQCNGLRNQAAQPSATPPYALRRPRGPGNLARTMVCLALGQPAMVRRRRQRLAITFSRNRSDRQTSLLRPAFDGRFGALGP